MSPPQLKSYNNVFDTVPYLPDNALDLLLVLEVDLVAVLWSHEHGRIAEGRVPQARAMALNHR